MSYSFGINFLKGIGSVIEIFPERNYVRPEKNGFIKDKENLRKDNNKICKGLRNEANKEVRKIGETS